MDGRVSKNIKGWLKVVSPGPGCGGAARAAEACRDVHQPSIQPVPTSSIRLTGEARMDKPIYTQALTSVYRRSVA